MAKPAPGWPHLARRVAAVVAVGSVCGWLPVEVTYETGRQHQAEQQQREQLIQREQELARNDFAAWRERQQDLGQLHHLIDYPPVGEISRGPDGFSSVTDAPPEANGSHYHCEQGFMADPLGIGGSIGGACSFRWPDGSIAPPPPRP